MAGGAAWDDPRRAPGSRMPIAPLRDLAHSMKISDIPFLGSNGINALVDMG